MDSEKVGEIREEKERGGTKPKLVYIYIYIKRAIDLEEKATLRWCFHFFCLKKGVNA